ncbi:MAG: HAMP domain-containing histidine kinase [Reichenbachiella sp.]
MRFTNKHVIYLFILSILLPTVILSFLSIRSITQEVVILEKKESDQLKEFESVTRTAINTYLDHTYRSAAQMSMMVYDILPNPSQNPQNYSFDKLPEINGLFLYYKNKLIYPNLGFIFTDQDELFTHELDAFEKKWITPPKTKASRLALIRKRVRRTQNKSLSPFLQKMNFVEIIKLYSLIENHRGTIKYCNKLLEFKPIAGLYSKDITVWLWLTQFRAYIAMNRYTNAIELTKEIINHYFQNPNSYNINQIKFLRTELFNTLLSYEYLGVRDRDFLWNINVNWELHTKHSYQFVENRDILTTLMSSSLQSLTNTNTYSDSAQIFIKISTPFFTQNQILITSFNKTHFLTSLLKSIPSTLAKKISYRVSYDGSLISNHERSSDVEFYKDISVSSLLPKLRFQIFKTEADKLIVMANRKKIFLYSLLATSIITLIVGSAVIIRGIRQEKKLLYMKTNFVSSVSHELKTPITSIKMLSETLKTGRITDPAKVIQYSGLIEKESNRLQSLIDDILQYSKWEQAPSSFSLTKINLSTLVEDTIQTFHNQSSSRSITLRKEITPHCIIEGNEKSILSVIQNLIDNAIKYSPDDASILVTVTNLDSEICYRVKDNGSGIPKNEQHKIFADFYRVGSELTRTTKGSGLGLAIVKRIIDAHNARITVESKPNEGALFSVFFKKKATA